MATIQQGGSSVTATSTKNNGGTSVNAGTKSSQVEGLSLGRTIFSAFGSTVIDGTNTDPADASGTFAYSNLEPIAMRSSSVLAGVAKTVLQSGASVPSLTTGIHYINSIRTRRLTTAIRAGYWNIFNGTFSSAPTVAVDTFYTDEAATVSRTSPGTLAYMVGKTPVQDSYAEKTG
jgi:hypothetical protein